MDVLAHEVDAQGQIVPVLCRGGVTEPSTAAEAGYPCQIHQREATARLLRVGVGINLRIGQSVFHRHRSAIEKLPLPPKPEILWTDQAGDLLLEGFIDLMQTLHGQFGAGRQ
ncbi:MAG: hypothetical protein EBS01_09995 [Verrucomicrobia bacterium]|nr:hypothetical protein [Verrucomicrobiota bacterium]